MIMMISNFGWVGTCILDFSEDEHQLEVRDEWVSKLSLSWFLNWGVLRRHRERKGEISLDERWSLNWWGMLWMDAKRSYPQINIVTSINSNSRLQRRWTIRSKGNIANANVSMRLTQPMYQLEVRDELIWR